MNESFLSRYPIDGGEPEPKPDPITQNVDTNGLANLEGDNGENGLDILAPVNHQRMVTVVGLELDIDGSTFQYGKIRIECKANMFKLHSSSVELVLEEERPRLASVLGTRESSLGSYLDFSALLNTLDFGKLFWSFVIVVSMFTGIILGVFIRLIWKQYYDK